MPDLPYLGTAFQGATFFTLLLAVIGGAFTVFRYWVQGSPERSRALHEGRIIENHEYARQQKIWNEEVHFCKNQVMKLVARQTELERLLTHALATSSVRKDQMDNMMSLIELLINEVETRHPESIIAPQARVLFKQMRAAANRKVDPFVNNPNQSDALNAAEHTVEAAEITKSAAIEVRKEVEKKEENGK